MVLSRRSFIHTSTGCIGPFDGTGAPLRTLLPRVGHILIDKALTQGPRSLSQEEKMHLLSDPDSIADLHRLVWELPDGEVSAQWGISPG